MAAGEEPKMHLSAFALAAVLLAQPATPTPPGPPSAPPETEAHFTVSTTDAGAQAAFDRGLTLLYAFNPQEARRAFEQAATLDPKLAIAQWGIAMSYGVDINTPYVPSSQAQGHDAITRAQMLATAATTTPLEHALIDAAVPRYRFTAEQDADRSARAFSDAMASVAARFPHDVLALVLAAEAAMDCNGTYWTKDGQPEAGTLTTIALLHQALAIDPQNIGANHLLIHMLEASPHPQDALPAAEVLAGDQFEPAAEHLAHMPAHIFMRVGDYHAAGEANRLAVEHFEAYLKSDHAVGHEQYLAHDLVFEVEAYMMSGEFAQAQRAAQDFKRDVRVNSPFADDVAVRFGHCELVSATSGFAAGYCSARAGQTAQAQKISHDLRALGSDLLTIPADLIDAQLAENRGDRATAIALLQHAVSIQDNFPYQEPPAWFLPVRERLGAVYYRAGEFADAERTFRDDLLRNPNNPRSLFGLARSLEQEGKADEAADVQREFETAWAHADTSLDMKDL